MTQVLSTYFYHPLLLISNEIHLHEAIRKEASNMLSCCQATFRHVYWYHFYMPLVQYVLGLCLQPSKLKADTTTELLLGYYFSLGHFHSLQFCNYNLFWLCGSCIILWSYFSCDFYLLRWKSIWTCNPCFAATYEPEPMIPAKRHLHSVIQTQFTFRTAYLLLFPCKIYLKSSRNWENNTKRVVIECRTNCFLPCQFIQGHDVMVKVTLVVNTNNVMKTVSKTGQ